MIKIESLKLRSITSKETYGADISFTSGLNIIQASNTSGKSTCLQSIVYALGVERFLGPALEVPLPYAMRQRIHAHKDDPFENVLQSFVELEISNAAGEQLSIRRDIVGGADQKLIKTRGGKLSDLPTTGNGQRDYFVHDGGSATRADGFHKFLSEFIGWELPLVPTFEGNDCPLYLETLFPMFFVEQKRGWSTTQGPFPTFLRIQDMPRRVMEYILDLDAGKKRREIAETKKLISQLEQQWTNRRKDLSKRSGALVRISGLPHSPTAEFAHDPHSDIVAFHDGDWLSLDELTTIVADRAETLEAPLEVRVEDNTDQLKMNLEDAETRNTDLAAKIAVVRDEYQNGLSEYKSVEMRLEALRIDLRRNQDAQKLQKLGSTVGLAASGQSCPTCHQSVSRELLPETVAVGMGVAENIAFIRSQIDLYSSMRTTTDDNLDVLRVRINSLQADQNDTRRQIRAIKDDLMRPSSSIVRSEIEELVRLQSKLESLTSLQEEIDGALSELQTIAREWIRLKDQLRSLGSGQLSISDQSKVSALQEMMRDRLLEFGFNTFPPEEITVAADNFRPQVIKRDDEGSTVETDIGFEASASDGIRLKWAYYLSILALSQKFSTNHLGLLIFDEPGQQAMEEVDLMALLEWASKNIYSDRQFIVATSEKLSNISNAVRNDAANIVSFSNFILQPM